MQSNMRSREIFSIHDTGSIAGEPDRPFSRAQPERVTSISSCRVHSSLTPFKGPKRPSSHGCRSVCFHLGTDGLRAASFSSCPHPWRERIKNDPVGIPSNRIVFQKNRRSPVTGPRLHPRWPNSRQGCSCLPTWRHRRLHSTTFYPIHNSRSFSPCRPRRYSNAISRRQGASHFPFAPICSRSAPGSAPR